MLSHARRDSIIEPPSRRQNRLSRITPRTCLWPLAGCLVVTFLLSIGLTFQARRHCYAGICGEGLFPLQVRLHVLVWYSWFSISVVFLAVRAFNPDMKKPLAKQLLRRKIPLIDKQLSLSGALMFAWILILYASIVGIWWIRLRNYFVNRGDAGGIFKGGNRLAATALTGHFCDVTLGIVLIPISRHSALTSFFKLSVSTTLTLHIIAASTLFILVLAHGLLYVSWIPVFESLSQKLRLVYPVLNPTYPHLQVWPGSTSALGIWRASLIFSGIVAFFIMSTILLTTLPAVRSKHFNLFYYTHFLSIVMVIIACLHASTIFYCAAPGLAMWLLDWGMRLYELRRALNGQIATLGKEWYCVTMPLPRHRLRGCSNRSPVAHFYIHHSDSSIRELHPFTTITHLASENSIAPSSHDHIDIQFLFRKRGNARVTATDVTATIYPLHTSWLHWLFRGKRKRVQWTEKLASIAHHHALETTQSLSPKFASRPVSVSSLSTSASSTFVSSTSASSTCGPSFPSISVALRLEGPYFSPADPSRYRTVVCLVAGTGISGAVAIARAFTHMWESGTAKPKAADAPSTTWERCVVVWSIREEDYVELPFLKHGSKGLEIQTHLTGEGRPKLDLGETMAAIRSGTPEGRIWAYIAGPKGFIEAGNKACEGMAGVEISWS